MIRSWTAEQLSAIETRDRTVLVSAAAGSGKTATLTERVIRSLCDSEHPADISRMLISTFTRAAASDLVAKITAALTAALASDPRNTRLAEQLVLIRSAKICTIHSYCYDLVKSNFGRLGLSPALRIGDEAETGALRETVMEGLINECYGRGGGYPGFFNLFSNNKTDKGLASFFLGLYDKLRTFPDGVGLLRTDEGGDFMSGRYGEALTEYVAYKAESYAEYFAAALDIMTGVGAPTSEYGSYVNLIEYEHDFALRLLEAANGGSYESIAALLSSVDPPKPRAAKGFTSDRFEWIKDCHKNFAGSTGFVKTLYKNFFSLSRAELEKAQITGNAVNNKLCEFLLEFEARYDAEKLRLSICDFSDIEHFTLRLLYENGEPSDVARAVRDEFDSIYIDEYQDVNDVQNMIFRAIARPDNCFTVGDIKQSIYRFRGSNPASFAALRESYTPLADAQGKEPVSIFLSDNFRSSAKIIEFVNTVFSPLFGLGGSRFPYREEDNLVAKRTFPDGFTPPDVRVIIADTDTPDDDDENGDENALPDGINPEAHLVALEIKKLLDSGRILAETGEPVRPSDIAILLRSANRAFAMELARMGIPCETPEGGTLFDSHDVLLLVCLLNTIDNPRRDLYLSGLLLSPLFNFSLCELVKVRRENRDAFTLYDALSAYTEHNDFDKGRRFFASLESYRRLAASLPTDELISALFEETKIISILTSRAADDGERERIRKNYLSVYEYARRFEANAYRGLYAFLACIGDENNKKSLPKAAAGSSSGNAVRIMTVHASKGLEFPVCFLSDTAKKFNRVDLSQDIIFSEKLGISLRLRTANGRAKIDTPMRRIAAVTVSDALFEEELCTLYVALTRAKEQLIVTAKGKAANMLSDARDAAYLINRNTILSQNSFAKCLLLALAHAGETDCIETLTVADTVDTDTAETAPAITPETATTAATDELRRRFAFAYPYSAISAIPAKLSVSKLYPSVLDDIDDADTLRTEYSAELPVPKFISNAAPDAASRGTATHLFMQFCDFESVLQVGVAAELDRLVDKRFISSADAAAVNITEAESFFASPLFSRIKASRDVRREFRFNTLLPAREFSQSDALKASIGDEKLLVQGVVDCFFEENGNIILLDYKTDRLSDFELSNPEAAKETLSARHASQLNYYAGALEKITGKPVAERLIFSLCAGRSYEI